MGVSNRLPGDEALFADAVREHLERAGRKGLTQGELASALPPETAGELDALLLALETEGEAACWNRRWFALRWTDWVVGRVRSGRGGDALLASGERGEAGYLIPRRQLGAARDGDLVLARPQRRGRRRRSASLPEASVLKVLVRRASTVVGFTAEEDGRTRLVPYDSKLPLTIRLGEDLEPGLWVEANLAESGGRSGTVPAQVAEVLGSHESPGVDTEVVLRHHGIPREFPREVEAACADLPSDPGPGDMHGREDLRDTVVFTIDGADARDFDDAIGVERLPGGGFRLGVHIADVAHYVPEGGVLDLEAYRRGTSVYYPERVVPMFPEALSNGLCSLRPDVPRLAHSIFLDFTADGELEARRFADSVICSHRRLTYTESRRLLEEPRRGDERDYGEVLGVLEAASQLMRVLYRRRLDRGSVDFDLPEGNVILDSDGVTVGVKPGERTVAHRIVEECMIAANEAVALELWSHEAPALFRVHEPPAQDRLEELRELLRPLGLTLPEDLTALHPSHLQQVLERAEGTEDEPFVSSVVLRSMQRASYSPEPKGHYALASRHYAHFTSPIRRYPDLVVHRRLRALRHGTAQHDAAETALSRRLPAIASHCSDTERRAERSERELLRWKLLRLLAEREGEVMSGRITGVQPFGFFVELDRQYVDGLVPIHTLTDDFYLFEAERRRLVGRRSERTFRLADRLEVRLVKVDPLRRMVDLEIPGMPEPEPERRGSRRGPRGR
ncbi:MAG: ribonuclease R [Thermoanaerobaculia bacterium]